MTTVFVTALIHLREDRSKDRTIETRFQHFKKLAATGVPIILFLSEAYSSVDLSAYPNVQIQPCELEDLWIYKQLHSVVPALPSERNIPHDTLHFMILMNSKIEFVQRAASITESSVSHLAWIDFNVFHIAKNVGAFMNRIQLIANSKLQKTLLVIPGCWSPGYQKDSLFSRVNWRFCGGFFIGDRASLNQMDALYKTHFVPTTLSNGMTWEVNFWSYLENDCGWTPSWYSSNHDNSLIAFPSTYFSVVASLTTIPSRIGVDCKKAIDSILSQVDHVYLSVSKRYERFSEPLVIPAVYFQEPYASKVSIVICDDFGSISKYIGSNDRIPQNQWMFICDDDQEYKPTLIRDMMNNVTSLSAYQNHYNGICRKTSGGLVHGYVGNLTHRSFLNRLAPQSSGRHIDDQQMSVYYYLNNVSVKSSGVEEYENIFSVLEGGHEKCQAADSLAALGTRETLVWTFARESRIRFLNLANGSGNNGLIRFLQQEPSARTGTYTYPSIYGYEPSSSSFLMYKGQPLLNVRYINYSLSGEGRYIIQDGQGYLRSENMLMTLDETLTTIKTSHKLTIPTPPVETCVGIHGLEDIRLYESNGTLCFIATQREWSPNRMIRTIKGTIDDGSVVSNLVILEPPTYTSCEKNWIPVNGRFIYQWYPLQIGTVQENGTLVIDTEHTTPPLFERVRGSTCPQKDSDGHLWFVVHYSNDTVPRNYYHMLVVLDGTTLKLRSYSQPFVFGRIGIEFCIGFRIHEEGGSRLRFWYSQHDCDPVWITVDREAFSMCF